jgi:hypothetical protein
MVVVLVPVAAARARWPVGEGGGGAREGQGRGGGQDEQGTAAARTGDSCWRSMTAETTYPGAGPANPQGRLCRRGDMG